MTADISAIWQHALSIPPPKDLLTAQEQQHKSQTKDPIFRKDQIWGNKGQVNGPIAEKG